MMLCPSCEVGRTRVIDTGRLGHEHVVRVGLEHRRRRCTECNYTFTTWEQCNPAHGLEAKKQAARAELKKIRSRLAFLLEEIDEELDKQPGKDASRAEAASGVPTKQLPGGRQIPSRGNALIR